MKRGGPIARKQALTRSKRLRPRNAKRAARRKAECFGAQAAVCRTLTCCILHCDEQAEPHHEPPRSCGGTDADCVPLCRQHHRQRHDMGRVSFWGAYGNDVTIEKYRVRALVEGRAA